MNELFCGIDWAEHHHDVALADTDGTQVVKLRTGDDSAGFRTLLELLPQHGDSTKHPLPVAIETPRGLLPQCLRATGRTVYAINPFAVARYRDRVSVARAKSADARLLANILRTDLHGDRPLPDDGELAQPVVVLARAHQDAIWDRQQLVTWLHSHLREYFPGALIAFHGTGTLGLDSADARVVPAAAPTPAAAARFSRARLRALLNRAGRLWRGLDAEVDRLHAVFRTDHCASRPRSRTRWDDRPQRRSSNSAPSCRSVEERATATEEVFLTHPDAEIITRLSRLWTLSGARVLAELGDDRSRFADAKALKAYGGAAPVTRASGRSHVGVARTVKNQRLAAAGYRWALVALRSSAPREHYDRRRARANATPPTTRAARSPATQAP